MGSFNKTKPLLQNTKIISSPIDDEMVMMNVEKGSYFGLDYVGVEIWNLLEKPLMFDELIEKLTQKYSVKEEQCLEEVTPFIEALFEANILVNQS